MRAADLPPDALIETRCEVVLVRHKPGWWRLTGRLVTDAVVDEWLERGDATAWRAPDPVTRVWPVPIRRPATAPAQPLRGETGSGVHPDTPAVSEASEGP